MHVLNLFSDSWGAEAMESDLNNLNQKLAGSPIKCRQKSNRLRSLQQKKQSDLDWIVGVKKHLMDGTDEGLKVRTSFMTKLSLQRSKTNIFFSLP